MLETVAVVELTVIGNSNVAVAAVMVQVIVEAATALVHAGPCVGVDGIVAHAPTEERSSSVISRIGKEVSV